MICTLCCHPIVLQFNLFDIIPKSKGGDNSLDNLQFLTVFENLSKRDMTMKEWNEFKVRTNTQSDLYL